jgi:hypothetical protein
VERGVGRVRSTPDGKHTRHRRRAGSGDGEGSRESGPARVRSAPAGSMITPLRRSRTVALSAVRCLCTGLVGVGTCLYGATVLDARTVPDAHGDDTAAWFIPTGKRPCASAEPLSAAEKAALAEIVNGLRSRG